MQFKKLNKSAHQHYKNLKDSIYLLPHLPLHKHLRSSGMQTYIGLGYQKSFEDLCDSILNNPNVVDSRQDSIGHHYMLKTKERSAYLMLKNTSKYPLLFINISEGHQNLNNLFYNKTFYKGRFKCD